MGLAHTVFGPKTHLVGRQKRNWHAKHSSAYDPTVKFLSLATSLYFKLYLESIPRILTSSYTSSLHFKSHLEVVSTFNSTLVLFFKSDLH